MNCKPGDLAIVVIGRNAGKLFTCLKLKYVRVFLSTGEMPLKWCWEADCNFEDWSGDIVDNLIEDDLIRPIRNPGEDARDETLSWLPVPTRESTPA